MKEIQEEQLRFVARHWKAGRFNPRRAWRHLRALGAFRSSGHPSRIPFPRLALATAFAAAVVTGLFLFYRDPMTVVPATATVQTVVLPDGSQASLAPGATLSFHRRGFGRRDRSARMTGRIFFSIARNESLPFEITAEEGFVHVLGTRFQVEADSSGTAVDVVDGRVLFCAVQAQDGLILTKGMHAELPSGAVMPTLDEPATPNPAAWATHTFIYDNTPLEDVLRELSAHFGHPLGSDERDRKLTGEFESDDLTEIISLIESALDIHISL